MAGFTSWKSGVLMKISMSTSMMIPACSERGRSHAGSLRREGPVRYQEHARRTHGRAGGAGHERLKGVVSGQRRTHVTLKTSFSKSGFPSFFSSPCIAYLDPWLIPGSLLSYLLPTNSLSFGGGFLGAARRRGGLG